MVSLDEKRRLSVYRPQNNMKKYGKLIITVLAFALVIGGAVLAYDKLKNQVQTPSLLEDDKTPGADQQGKDTDSDEAGKEPGQAGEKTDSDEAGKEQRQEAIDVTFYDSEGNAVKLSDFYGKPVVMNFWATWCGFCKQEMPDFQEAYNEYGEQVEFLFINATDGQRETREKAAAYLTEQSLTVPAYYDEDQQASYVYSVNSLPTTILLDKEGRVAAYVPGLVEKENLTGALDVLLGE